VIYKKVCILGAPGVGKTSLIQRFVNGLFDERYLVTIGAKIDARTVLTLIGEVQLMIWDLNGSEMFERVQTSYLRGMHGYLMVFDPTRPETLEFAMRLRETVEARGSLVPSVLIASKADLHADWQVSPAQLETLQPYGLLRASAKTGDGVETSFSTLARLMLEGRGDD
jgi:small GTP-binding protein